MNNRTEFLCSFLGLLEAVLVKDLNEHILVFWNVQGIGRFNHYAAADLLWLRL